MKDRNAGIPEMVTVAIMLLLLFLAVKIEERQNTGHRGPNRPDRKIDIDVCIDGKCPYKMIESLADVPPELRQGNYAPYGQGSCVHASMVTLLRWQGQEKLADWWIASYNSGEYSERLIERMSAAGVKFAYTDTGNLAFLEWACRNRLAAGIFYKPSHAICIVDLNETHAVLLDNNATEKFEIVPRAQFEYNWKNIYGGFAWTVVYQPPPPNPVQ